MSDNERIVKTLVMLRYTVSFVIGVTAGIGAEAVTALETKYIIAKMPGILSTILFGSAILRSFQFLTTKMTLKQSIWVPAIFDACLLPVIMTLFLTGYYFEAIVLQIMSESISSCLFLNRKNRIVETIKHHYKMDKFFNLMASLFSIGNIVGYLSSYICLKIGMSFETLWFAGFFVWIIPVVPTILWENKLLMMKKRGI